MRRGHLPATQLARSSVKVRLLCIGDAPGDVAKMTSQREHDPWSAKTEVMRVKAIQPNRKDNVVKGPASPWSLSAARVPKPPKPPSLAASLLALQRTSGNRHVQRVLTLAVQRDKLPEQHPKQIRTTHDIERQALPLAEKMGDALDHWKNQADWGIQNFVNQELEKRIDALRSAGLTTGDFLQGLIGNLIWSAACFIPGSPAIAFIVSVAGIQLTARTSPPSASDPADKGAVSGVAESMQMYLDKVEEAIRGPKDSHLIDQAKNVVLFNPDLGLPALLELLMSSYFDKSMLQAGPEGKLTRLNDEVVKKTQKQALATRFQHFIDAVTAVGTKTEADTVLGRKIGGEYTLSLIAVSGVGGAGAKNTMYGLGYEIKPRKTALDGSVMSLGEVAIAIWIPDDTVNDVLERESQLKIYPLIRNAFATEVKMGPDQFKAHEAELRKQSAQGGLRPG